eukprot:5065924-Pyramimonas_sp.AAC.1
MHPASWSSRLARPTCAAPLGGANFDERGILNRRSSHRPRPGISSFRLRWRRRRAGNCQWLRP